MKKITRLVTNISFLLILSVLISLSSSAFGAKKIHFHPSKKGLDIRDNELIMNPTSTRGYNESWIVWAWNKQGYNVYALIVATRMVFGVKLGVQLTIRTPDGKVQHKMVEYSSSKYRYRKDTLDILVPGKHRITYRKKRGFLSINFKKWGVVLRFKKLLSGYRLQNGSICQKRKCFRGQTYAPRISVKGTIRINGKTLPFKGMGHADHSWQDIMPHLLANRWYGARAMDKTYTLNTSHLLVPKKWTPRNISALMIAKGNKWIFRGDRTNTTFVARNYKKDKKSGYIIPRRMIYRGKYKGTKVKVDIKHIKEYDNLDILSQFNKVIRFILQRFIAKPFLFRYKLQAKVKIKYKSGKVEKFILYGYSEYVYFNQ